MFKTHTCGELRKGQVGQTTTLAGWVHRRRDHGGVIFIDLRDRFGLTQIVINPDNVDAGTIQARREPAQRVRGADRRAGERAPRRHDQPKMVTGEIEVMVTKLEILNPAKTPPFEIDSDGMDTR